MYVYITYNESYESGGEAIDPDDRWTSHETEYRSYSVIDAIIGEEKNAQFLRERFEIDWTLKAKDQLYVVVIRYGTGGTFGMICGCGKIEGVYRTYQEALAVEKSIYDKTYKGYKFWEGYFESLESVSIETLQVKRV